MKIVIFFILVNIERERAWSNTSHMSDIGNNFVKEVNSAFVPRTLKSGVPVEFRLLREMRTEIVFIFFS